MQGSTGYKPFSMAARGHGSEPEQELSAGNPPEQAPWTRRGRVNIPGSWCEAAICSVSFAGAGARPCLVFVTFRGLGSPQAECIRIGRRAAPRSSQTQVWVLTWPEISHGTPGKREGWGLSVFTGTGQSAPHACCAAQGKARQDATLPPKLSVSWSSEQA